jgi:ATP/maltotriose-dependent transcriptional regulator MalT
MRADAELALTLIPVGSLWRAPAQLLLGISQLLAGDLGVADRAVAAAVEVAQDTGATVAASVGPTSALSPSRPARLRSHLDQVRGEVIGAALLSTAELRLVPLLATHLSFREMGQRLYVSQHTVKTQAMSIDRKLGVSSRGQAVQRVQEIGLLAR